MKCYKLIYKSPMFGSVYCDALFEESDNRVEISPEGMATLYDRYREVQEFLDSNIEELDEYVPDELKELVLKATFGNYEIEFDRMYFVTEIYVKQEPDEEQYRQIVNWITGQMSDGWGEGLEQREVYEETVYKKNTYFDTDNCEFDEDEERVYATYYIHPWKHYEFYLGLYAKQEVEIDIPDEKCEEPVVYCAACKLQEDGGYEVKTVYQVNKLDSVIQCMENSGVCFSQAFTDWMRALQEFGDNVRFYFVCVNQGMFTKFPSALGILHKDSPIYHLWTMDNENGYVDMREYTEEESKDFYADLMSK